MKLKELIEWLETQPADAMVACGFGEPMSYRGYYDEVAFEPALQATLGEMLAYARSAHGATFTGYKGGEFTMGDDTPCWIAEHGRSGDPIGPTIIRMWERMAKEHGNG